MDDSERKRESMDSFGATADAYRESAVHREGDDLETLASWCEDAADALDVACGPGHTAGALADAGVETVVAADATPAMVETAVETFDTSGVVADAERLPFVAGAFDAVTCRIAAHHFPDPRAFVREAARVLEPGGTVAFEDNVAPAEDDLADFCNRFERLRDPSHVEAHSRSEWEAWFEAAGLQIEESLTMRRELDYEAWVDRTNPPASNREALADLVRRPEAEAVYGAVVDEEATVGDGAVREFGNRKVLIRAHKPTR
jgi:SAM-dependent methyltransferase